MLVFWQLFRSPIKPGIQYRSNSSLTLKQGKNHQKEQAEEEFSAYHEHETASLSTSAGLASHELTAKMQSHDSDGIKNNRATQSLYSAWEETARTENINMCFRFIFQGKKASSPLTITQIYQSDGNCIMIDRSVMMIYMFIT